ncbi:MAG: glycerol-3-phosphate 1-O-acyltransferase PlsY [Alphaproteobacteria bacterium]
MDHYLLTNPVALLAIVGAYFLGSIPFGLLFTRWGGKGDLRTIGSGNIGATNVLRTGSKFLALMTFLCDFLKGYLAVYWAEKWQVQDFAAVLVVLGHMFPVWLKFKGGKGVATYGGALFGLSIPLGAQAILGWVSFALIFKYSSLAALLAALLVPFTVWLWSYGEPLLYTTLGLSFLLIAKHYENILRLMRRKEPKIGQKE